VKDPASAAAFCGIFAIIRLLSVLSEQIGPAFA
jgi:hypothetical protein